MQRHQSSKYLLYQNVPGMTLYKNTLRNFDPSKNIAVDGCWRHSSCSVNNRLNIFFLHRCRSKLGGNVSLDVFLKNC